MFRLEDMKKYIILSLLCGCLSVNAQTMVPLTYRQYMERVAEGNLEYASEKLNVPAAKAEVTAAKVFNDPNLSVSYFNNENNSLQMGEGVEVELSKTFSFGKRGANISLARSESELTEALLADYFRNLRADATIAYMEALKQHELYKVKENAYENIRTLAESDSIRFSLGQIREVDATQSRVEAGVLRNELLQAGAELKNAFSNLNFLTGTFSTDTLFHPEAELRTEPRDFILADLITAASEGRTDLVAALKNKEVAARALKVARRERNTDVDLSIAVSRNARVYNEEAPAPPFTGVTACPICLYAGTLYSARFGSGACMPTDGESDFRFSSSSSEKWSFRKKRQRCGGVIEIHSEIQRPKSRLFLSGPAKIVSVP